MTCLHGADPVITAQRWPQGRCELSAAWRAWRGPESHWNLGTGGGGVEAAPPRGLDVQFSDTTQRGFAESQSSRGREEEEGVCKKRPAWTGFASATAHPGCHIPEGGPPPTPRPHSPSSLEEADTPSSQTLTLLRTRGAGVWILCQPFPVWL